MASLNMNSRNEVPIPASPRKALSNITNSIGSPPTGAVIVQLPEGVSVHQLNELLQNQARKNSGTSIISRLPVYSQANNLFSSSPRVETDFGVELAGVTAGLGTPTRSTISPQVVTPLPYPQPRSSSSPVETVFTGDTVLSGGKVQSSTPIRRPASTGVLTPPSLHSQFNSSFPLVEIYETGAVQSAGVTAGLSTPTREAGSVESITTPTSDSQAHAGSISPSSAAVQGDSQTNTGSIEPGAVSADVSASSSTSPSTAGNNHSATSDSDQPRIPREQNALHILFQNYDGQQQIAAHAHTKQAREECLRTKSRVPAVETFQPMILAKIIVKNEMYISGSHSISHETYDRNATLICQYLDGEKEGDWYTRGFRDGKKAVSAKGHLPSATYSINRKARKLHKIGVRRPTPYNIDAFQEINSDDEDEENIDDAFIIGWVRDAVQRYNQAQRKSLNKLFLLKNGAYGKPNGFKLILADYKAVFPDSADSLIKKWPQVAKMILELAEMYRDSSVLINDILTINKERKTSAHVQNVALQLIPALLVCLAKSPKVISKKWKPPPQTICDGFLLRAPNLAGLQTTRDTFEQLLTDQNEPIQPYVVICGPLEKIEYSCAIVNNIAFNMSTPLDAIDFCFKAVTILRTPFSKLSSDSWKFLGEYIYKNNNSGLNLNVKALRTLLEDATRIAKTSEIQSTSAMQHTSEMQATPESQPTSEIHPTSEVHVIEVQPMEVE